jgi:uncharacterized membrane protein
MGKIASIIILGAFTLAFLGIVVFYILGKISEYKANQLNKKNGTTRSIPKEVLNRRASTNKGTG